jgi:hypothetical protein
MIPAPWIYLAGLSLGIALGVALDSWLGWPWWAVTLAIVAVVWLVFLLSAFTGPARGVGLGDELLDVIRPGRALERRARRQTRLVRGRPFPIYGLDPTWTGARGLGGVGWRGGSLTSVELTHGDPIRGPWVRIETVRKDHLHDDPQEIASILWHRMEQAPPDVPDELREDWIRRRVQDRRMRNTQWTRASIPVDGEPMGFDWLDENSDWAAHTHIGPLVVTIDAHRVPLESVRLAVVTDVEPYLENDVRFPRGDRRSDE